MRPFLRTFLAVAFVAPYDAKRVLTKAELTRNGQHVCTFTYERLADGTVKRTLAKGPGNVVWAEYPDRAISEIEQDGKPIDNGPATIHKSGNWW